MARTKANAELDGLIEEITVDCYDEDEQLQGFENAFDEDTTFWERCTSRILARSRYM